MPQKMNVRQKLARLTELGAPQVMPPRAQRAVLVESAHRSMPPEPLAWP
jgi:hypothetical protein